MFFNIQINAFNIYVVIHNDYRSSVAPLPLAEFFSHAPSSAQSSSAGGDVGGQLQSAGCAEDDPSCVDRPALTKRQVDPLHSCIEAKCASWNHGGYLDCVYRHCVTGFRVHGKRSTDAVSEQPADASAAADTSFAHPEGRFLLLPVTFQSPDVEHQLFPAPPSADDEDDEARRTLVTRARLDRRRKSTSRDRPRSRRLRVKRNVVPAPEWNDPAAAERRVGGGSRNGGGSDWAARLRASSLLLPKRSYNDIADVCVEHHCGRLAPHTISFFQCVEHHCTGK